MGQRAKERGRGGVGEREGGRLLALPPGVLSNCQEADRFPLSGLECACAVYCVSIYLQRTYSQSTHEYRAVREGVHLTEALLLLPTVSSKCNGEQISRITIRERESSGCTCSFHQTPAD